MFGVLVNIELQKLAQGNTSDFTNSPALNPDEPPVNNLQKNVTAAMDKAREAAKKKPVGAK